jgi:hypothetical protein
MGCWPVNHEESPGIQSQSLQHARTDRIVNTHIHTTHHPHTKHTHHTTHTPHTHTNHTPPTHHKVFYGPSPLTLRSLLTPHCSFSRAQWSQVNVRYLFSVLRWPLTPEYCLSTSDWQSISSLPCVQGLCMEKSFSLEPTNKVVCTLVWCSSACPPGPPGVRGCEGSDSVVEGSAGVIACFFFLFNCAPTDLIVILDICNGNT